MGEGQLPALDVADLQNVAKVAADFAQEHGGGCELLFVIAPRAILRHVQSIGF